MFAVHCGKRQAVDGGKQTGGGGDGSCQKNIDEGDRPYNTEGHVIISTPASEGADTRYNHFYNTLIVVFKQAVWHSMMAHAAVSSSPK